MNLQCHWEFATNFQNVFVATRILSLPSDPGSLSCTWAVHRMARAIRVTLLMTSTESRTTTIPCGRNMRSISTNKSTKLNLPWTESLKTDQCSWLGQPAFEKMNHRQIYVLCIDLQGIFFKKKSYIIYSSGKSKWAQELQKPTYAIKIAYCKCKTYKGAINSDLFFSFMLTLIT